MIKRFKERRNKMKKNKLVHIAITSIMLLSTVLTPQMSHAIASMQAEEADETTEVDPTNSSDVEAVNAESVSDLEDGSDGGDRAEIVDVDGEGESEEAEDDPAPTEDDEVADETPEDINNNDPPVEEKVEEEEVEEEVKSSQAVTPMADLGNIFEFEYFRKDGADVEDGHEVDFDAEYQLQYKWDTKDAEVKAGDTATLTLPDVFKQWPENTPSSPIETATGEVVGNYTISNGELKFVFNEKIEDADVHNGFVGLNLQFDLEKFQEEWEQEIDFDGDGDKDLTVVVKPGEVETSLDKEGHPDRDRDAREITWSVDITNGSEEDISNGVLKDILPEGVDAPRDFVVKELTFDFEGNKVVGEEVSFNEPTVDADGFEMTFDNVPARGGYRVEYTTTIINYEISEFTNDATFVSEDVNLEAKTTVTTGERSNPIQKSGNYNWNTGQIDWTIIVNENGMEIENAIVHDQLPEKLILVDGSIEVKKNWQVVEDFNPTGFPIELGEVNADEFYEINFSTNINWSEVNGGEYIQGNTFTNKTELTDGEDPIGEDDATVEFWRETLLSKSGNASDYDYEDKVLSWTIDVNKAKHPISNAVITDILPAGIEITENDIEITNEAGETVSAEGITITPLEDGRNEVKIELGDIGTETLKVTYQTEVTDFEVDDFKNEASLDGEGVGEDSPKDDATVYPPGNSYTKDFKGIDYSEKTMDWNIAVDPQREAITELTIEDTFPVNGMILLPESVVVKIGDAELLEGTDYTLVPNTEGEDTGYNKGFTIKFTNISEDSPLNEHLTVDFKTSYDPQLEVDGNTADDHIGDPTHYINHAGFTGKTESGHDIEEEDDTDTKVREDSWNSGKKEGQLVHVDEDGNLIEGWESGSERKVAWQLYTNYQKQNLGTSVVITDTLDYEGTIDEDSITVSVYEVSADGETTITDDTITNYEVSVNGKEFTLKFDEDFVVDERYVVQFTTTVPDISQEKYTNNASVKVGDKEYPYSGTVNYDKWNDYLDKQALGQEGSEVFIGEELEWEVTVNENLSIIKNASIKDVISAGLAYVEDSLEIITSSDSELVEGKDYTLEVTTTDAGETVLDIVFVNKVTEALTLNYKTIVVAENNQQVNNKVELNGDGIENKSKETDRLTAKQFSWVGGEYNPKRGVIVVEKVDSEGNIIETGEATFELYFEMNGERVLVGEYSTENGILEIPNLPLRTYYLVEVAAPEGYVITDQEIEVEVDEVYGDSEKVFDISVTNYREDEEPELTEISVTKEWDDEDDVAGFRPESITVNLLANDEVIDSKELNEDNNWSHVFSDLPTVDEDRNDIEYTVEEVEVPNYTSEVVVDAEDANKFIVTNTHEPELIDIEGTKTWDDANNQDGKRPESITVRLLANGEEVDSDEITEEDEWKYSFADLPKFENGEEINYTVQEDGVDDYSTEIDGFNITNSYTPEQTSINVVKAWDDANNQDGKRPDEITVKLLANGEETGETRDLNAENNWQDDFTELDVKANGEDIVYTIEEVEVEGYEVVQTGTSEDGYVLTNIYEPELINIEGTKTWNDANNQDGKRPESITVRLLANGEEVDSDEITEEDEWKYSFIDLPKFENGEEINYTVQEDGVENYSTEIDGFNITNSYTPGKTSVNVGKAWNDNNNVAKRPDSITINLLANGEKIDSVKLNAKNNWQADFTDLDEYKNGKKIIYTVTEEDVKGFVLESIRGNADDGFIITNRPVEDPEKPEDPDPKDPSGEDPKTPEEPEESEEPKDDSVLPKTGEAVSYTLLAVILIGLGFGVVFYKRKRTNE